MRRGWVATLNDGTVMSEDKYLWKEVPNKDIKSLTLHFDGRRWELVGKQAYFVKNRASMVPGIQASLRVERRCIGYYEGANKVHYIVDEATGKFTMEVQDNSEG
jgi:hypothetical protein